jgi:hypothetical protein
MCLCMGNRRDDTISLTTNRETKPHAPSKHQPQVRVSNEIAFGLKFSIHIEKDRR